ncbi:hypothetical protein GQ43DRAFT_160093 [Delitschia confertaspora ATCC 74209]|uniref:Uncharacterized protein n=1 Tax=Delitschia confertaspora ATCC 74209 TaxID=1513339 RepID=A0A9P4JV86_9PLEO|nr:hypothetical protein GQ43DRAFT_160093 [Delitschia confertaspora ATCC 74209]
MNGYLVYQQPRLRPQAMARYIAYVGISIFPFFGNFWFRKLLRIVEAVGAICHVVFFIVSIITLAVLAEKSSVEYVFATLTRNISGWTNPADAWGIGLLTVTFPLTDTNPFIILAIPSL